MFYQTTTVRTEVKLRHTEEVALSHLHFAALNVIISNH